MIWAAGETTSMETLRNVIRHQWKWLPAQTHITGYWKRSVDAVDFDSRLIRRFTEAVEPDKPHRKVSSTI